MVRIHKPAHPKCSGPHTLPPRSPKITTDFVCQQCPNSAKQGKTGKELSERPTSPKCQRKVHLCDWDNLSPTHQNTPNYEWGSVGRRVASSRSDFVDRGAVGRKKTPRRQEPPRRPPAHRLS